MPLGAYVSETVGWPAGFVIVGLGALVAAAALRITIPRGLKIAPMVDRIGAAQVTLLGLISMLASHVLWLFVPGSWLLLFVFLLLWGVGCFSTNSAQQARLVMLSPPHAPVSVAMNSSAMYFGQAVGTAAGAAVLAGVAGPSAYTALAFISVPLFVASIAVSLLAERKQVAA